MDRLDPREALARLLKERGEDFAGLSRLIGKNPAYIQQFIKRGTPKKLDPDDVRILAQFFDVSEAELGGRASDPIDAKGAAGGRSRLPAIQGRS